MNNPIKLTTCTNFPRVESLKGRIVQEQTFGDTSIRERLILNRYTCRCVNLIIVATVLYLHKGGVSEAIAAGKRREALMIYCTPWINHI
jgi:hypothetical protein